VCSSPPYRRSRAALCRLRRLCTVIGHRANAAVGDRGDGLRLPVATTDVGDVRAMLARKRAVYRPAGRGRPDALADQPGWRSGAAGAHRRGQPDQAGAAFDQAAMFRRMTRCGATPRCRARRELRGGASSLAQATTRRHCPAGVIAPRDLRPGRLPNRRRNAASAAIRRMAAHMAPGAAGRTAPRLAVAQHLANVRLVRRDDRPCRRHVFEDLQTARRSSPQRLERDIETGDSPESPRAVLQTGKLTRSARPSAAA